MTTILRRGCLVFFLLFISPRSDATVHLNQGVSAFLGVGSGLRISTFRIGYDSWEFGALSLGFVGAAKNFIWTESTYSSFGFGVNTDGFDTRPGFQAAVGFNFDIFWGLALRGELMARTNFNGNAVGNGLLGASYDF